MKQSTFSFKDDTVDVTITVQQATMRQGLLRAVLLARGYAIPADPADETREGLLATVSRYAAVSTVPAIVSATVGVTNGESAQTKIDLEALLEDPMCLLDLPEELTNQWEREILKLNPFWVHPITEKEIAEGEAEEPEDSVSSPSGSSPGSIVTTKEPTSPTTGT